MIYGRSIGNAHWRKKKRKKKKGKLSNWMEVKKERGLN
jgi:peptide subunit release factor RF-3